MQTQYLPYTVAFTAYDALGGRQTETGCVLQSTRYEHKGVYEQPYVALYTPAGDRPRPGPQSDSLTDGQHQHVSKSRHLPGCCVWVVLSNLRQMYPPDTDQHVTHQLSSARVGRTMSCSPPIHGCEPSADPLLISRWQQRHYDVCKYYCLLESVPRQRWPAFLSTTWSAAAQFQLGVCLACQIILIVLGCGSPS